MLKDLTVRLQGLLVDYFGSPVAVVPSEDETVDTEENPPVLRREPEDMLVSLHSSVCEEMGTGPVQTIPGSSHTPATKIPVGEHTGKVDVRVEGMSVASEDTQKQLSVALLSAIRHNSEQVSLALLSPSSSLNLELQDPEGRSALHWAALNGSLPICKLLLSQEVDINLRDKRGRTPLLCACLGEHVEVTRALVESGADINAGDGDGNSPLHHAAISDNGSLVSFLIASGATQLSRNGEGKTPRDVAGVNTLRLFRSAPRMQKSATSAVLRLPLPLPPRSSLPLPKSPGSPLLPSLCRNLGPDDFQLLGILGKGSFGEVFLVKHKVDGKLLAMKMLRKEIVVGQNLVKYVMTERNVLSSVHHPFIVALTAAFQTTDRLFLLLDYCPGGDMGWHLNKEKRFSEYRTRIYAAEVLLALEYLHGRNVIFRDLKPENIVFDEKGHAMLTDFGLSREGVVDSTTAGSFCGSLAYLAPEVLKRSGHGKAVDWYLLGVLIYEMLVGHPPYYCQNRDQLFRNILNSRLFLPSTLSSEAKSLIQEVSFT